MQTDVVFLEREVSSRKQRFGIEMYDLMEALENDNELSAQEKDGRIRMAFDRARKDIAIVQAKIDCKNEEMKAIDAGEGSGAGFHVSSSSAGTSGAGSSGTNHIIASSHPDDSTSTTEGGASTST